jgi:hypothetical protein
VIWRDNVGDQVLDADFSVETAVIETVEATMTQEERDFGSLPNGQLLGRYALESYIEFVWSGSRHKGENRG